MRQLPPHQTWASTPSRSTSPIRPHLKTRRSFAACSPALALPLFRGDLLQRFERALDGHTFREREVLANGVLGELATRDGFEINDVDRNLGPAKQLHGAQSALAGNQHAV